MAPAVRILGIYFYICSPFAQVVELVDTPSWGGGASIRVQVRILFWAQKKPWSEMVGVFFYTLRRKWQNTPQHQKKKPPSHLQRRWQGWPYLLRPWVRDGLQDWLGAGFWLLTLSGSQKGSSHLRIGLEAQEWSPMITAKNFPFTP